MLMDPMLSLVTPKKERHRCRQMHLCHADSYILKYAYPFPLEWFASLQKISRTSGVRLFALAWASCATADAAGKRKLKT